MTTSDYVIYTIANCPYCDKAKDLLRVNGKVFHDIAVDMKPSIGAEVVKQTKQKTWPQIFYKGNFVGGYEDLTKFI